MKTTGSGRSIGRSTRRLGDGSLGDHPLDLGAEASAEALDGNSSAWARMRAESKRARSRRNASPRRAVEVPFCTSTPFSPLITVCFTRRHRGEDGRPEACRLERGSPKLLDVGDDESRAAL